MDMPKEIVMNVKSKVVANSITGNMTFKGVIKEITFPTKMVIKGQKAFANATITIDRTDFDVKYGTQKFIDANGDKAINNILPQQFH